MSGPNEQERPVSDCAKRKSLKRDEIVLYCIWHDLRQNGASELLDLRCILAAVSRIDT